jgi:hypothetical protein
MKHATSTLEYETIASAMHSAATWRSRFRDANRDAQKALRASRAPDAILRHMVAEAVQDLERLRADNERMRAELEALRALME